MLNKGCSINKGQYSNTQDFSHCVYSLVLLDLQEPSKGLSALLTLIGLLTGVDPLVLGKMGPLPKGLAALLALKGLLTSVDPLV